MFPLKMKGKSFDKLKLSKQFKCFPFPFKTIWIILLKPVKTFHFFFCSLEINFQRLRDWIGQHNGERYMVLLDVQDTQSTTAVTTAGDVGIINRSRYRCVVRVVLYGPIFIIIYFLLLSFLSIVCSYSTCSNFPSLPVKKKKRKWGGSIGNLFRVTWRFILKFLPVPFFYQKKDNSCTRRIRKREKCMWR